MKGTPPLSDQVLKPWPMSQWVAGLGRMLREARVLPPFVVFCNYPVTQMEYAGTAGADR